MKCGGGTRGGGVDAGMLFGGMTLPQVVECHLCAVAENRDSAVLCYLS